MNYQMADTLTTIMTEKEAEHQSALQHIMFNLKKFGYHGKLDWSRADFAEYERIRTPEEVGLLYEVMDKVQIPEIIQERSIANNVVDYATQLW
jgi:hypothetical protein